MATIIHRRTARRAPGSDAVSTVVTTPAEARGPGASLAPLRSLTWVGWASALVAAAWLVRGLWPLVESGLPDSSRWGDVALYVLRVVGDAAAVALPAALELGMPGARRRAPSLMRGAVLIALAQIVGPAIGWVQEIVVGALDPASLPVNYETPLGLAFGVLAVGSGLLLIAGLWSLSDGLWDAGSRPPRAILLVVAAIGAGGTLVAFLPFLGSNVDLSRTLGWLNLASIVLSLVTIALALVVATRLVAGLPARLVPRPAWALGAIAGVGVMVERFGTAVLLGTGGEVEGLNLVIGVASSAAWLILAVAFAAGLGRGAERRNGRRPLMHLYVRNPTD